MKKHLLVMAVMAGLLAGCGQGGKNAGGTSSSPEQQTSDTNMGPSTTTDTNKTNTTSGEAKPSQPAGGTGTSSDSGANPGSSDTGNP